MGLPSRKDQYRLSRELKNFAFEQSPMFARDLVQEMGLTQKHVLHEPVAVGEEVSGVLDVDTTTAVLGFDAIRFSHTEGNRPLYAFSVSLHLSQALHPSELELSDTSWEALFHTYGAFDSFFTDDGEPVADFNILADSDKGRLRDDIIENLVDLGHESMEYQSVRYRFASTRTGIEQTYERGIMVNEVAYDAVTSLPLGDDEVADFIQAPDGNILIPVDRPRDSTPLQLGDEVEIHLAFDSLISELGLEADYNNDTLTPHEDKAREMLYIVECMRRRYIRLA